MEERRRYGFKKVASSWYQVSSTNTIYEVRNTGCLPISNIQRRVKNFEVGKLEIMPVAGFFANRTCSNFLFLVSNLFLYARHLPAVGRPWRLCGFARLIFFILAKTQRPARRGGRKGIERSSTNLSPAYRRQFFLISWFYFLLMSNVKRRVKNGEVGNRF